MYGRAQTSSGTTGTRTSRSTREDEPPSLIAPQPVTATINSYVNPPDYIDIMAILSNVPSGYDVVDGVYTAWCVDRLGVYVYSDDLVYLYSSLNVPNVDQLDMRDWNRINYILNNVPPGATSADIQEAIWAFETMGGQYTPTRPLALAMVADALANGGDFVPTMGEYVAVIVFPADPEGDDLQVMIIQVLVSVHTTGKVTGGGQCITDDRSEIPAASFGFNAMWFSKDPTPKGELNYIDHSTGMHVHIHILDYLEVWQPNPGNKPEALRYAIFGGPCRINGVGGYYADVWVEDDGEPGTADKFQITLSTGYVGGSQIVNLLAGNIQIHKPPK